MPASRISQPCLVAAPVGRRPSRRAHFVELTLIASLVFAGSLRSLVGAPISIGQLFII